MKFFTKFKQAIETWLRTTIAAEVYFIDTLRSERAAFDAQLQSFEVRFDAALQRLIDNSDHAQQNIQLRATIKELNGYLAELSSIAKKL